MAGRQTRPTMRFDWRIDAPRSHADLAYDRLRQAIISGQFEPGQRVTEVGIATLMGVSRTPVRECFLRLEADGLLRVGAGGVEVVDPRGELTDIHLLREAAEAVAARLAAVRATDVEIDEISILAERTESMNPGDLAARASLNERFHLAIAAAAHAPRVERLVREYRSLFVTAERLGSIGELDTRRLLRQHTGIVEAIAAREPDEAETRMRDHLRPFLPDEPASRPASSA